MNKKSAVREKIKEGLYKLANSVPVKTYHISELPAKEQVRIYKMLANTKPYPKPKGLDWF
jgi:hypothetical protein